MQFLRNNFSIWFFALCSCTCARERGESADHPQAPTSTRSTRTAPDAGCSDEDLGRRARQVSSGYASYYADSLSGNLTASGATYDPDLYSAAHRTLPFGTRLRVTRTDREVSPVCVTVNDRGPFRGRRRVVDLSRRAAEALDMVSKGVVPVRVEVL
jgi:rare lipoprotein A